MSGFACVNVGADRCIRPLSDNECHFVTELKIAVGKSHKSIQISQILTNRFKDFLPLGAPLPFQGRGRGGSFSPNFRADDGGGGGYVQAFCRASVGRIGRDEQTVGQQGDNLR